MFCTIIDSHGQIIYIRTLYKPHQMRNIWMLVLSVFLLGNAFAQDDEFINKLDSLGGLDDSTKAIMAYNNGLDLMNAKDYSQAIQQFNEAYNKNNGMHDAIFNRGLCYMQLGSPDKAIGDWKSVIAKDSAHEMARYEVAHYYFKEGKYPEAQPLLDELMAMNPKEAKYAYDRGVIDFVAGDMEAALEKYNAAIKANANHAYALNDRGSIYMKQGQLDKAIADYEKAAKADSKSAFIFNNLGSAYRKNGDLDKAIDAYSKAVKLKDDYAIAYNNRGMAYFEKGQLEKARGDFDKALSIDAMYALAYNNRASISIKNEEWEAAVRDADKAISIDAEFAYAYYNRAIAKEMLRDLDQACEDWQKSYELGLDAGKTQMNIWCNQ
jgi:tetratricopeptide (TPR) repeat protein